MRFKRSASLPISLTNSFTVEASISFCKIESLNNLIDANGVFNSSKISYCSHVHGSAARNKRGKINSGISICSQVFYFNLQCFVGLNSTVVPQKRQHIHKVHTNSHIQTFKGKKPRKSISHILPKHWLSQFPTALVFERAFKASGQGNHRARGWQVNNGFPGTRFCTSRFSLF